MLWKCFPNTILEKQQGWRVPFDRKLKDEEQGLTTGTRNASFDSVAVFFVGIVDGVASIENAAKTQSLNWIKPYNIIMTNNKKATSFKTKKAKYF